MTGRAEPNAMEEEDREAVPVEARIILRFAPIGEQRGVVRYALWDSEEEWLSGTPLRGGEVAADADAAEVVIEGVATGIYAVSAFHDVNDNADLDTGRFNIPKEPYGFSENARRRFGPAKWEEAQFEVAGEALVFEIELK